MALLLVGLYSRDIDILKTSLSQVNFHEASGSTKAVEIQGQIKGLNRALDLMIDVANYEEEPANV